LTPLRAHKKRHSFKDTPEDAFRCGNGVETTEHFLLNYPFFHRYPQGNSIGCSKSYYNISIANPELVKILLYGDEKLNPHENRSILTETIKYIVNTERFC
jgi:hypothetical protein